MVGEIVEGRTFGELLSSEHKDYFYIMHLSYGGDKIQRERPWKFDGLILMLLSAWSITFFTSFRAVLSLFAHCVS